jgi:hypothetical protein
MDGQDVDQAGEGEHPQHPGLGRGQQELASGEEG